MTGGLLVIMGSGETAPTMVKPHREIFKRVGERPAVLIDTPYGFQENAEDISSRAIDYFAQSVGQRIGVVSWRTPPALGLPRERVLASLREAGWLFAGPGSPTYALRQWVGTEIPDVLASALARDAVVVFASAAAVTLGSHSVPVYEIYKAGIEPHWVPGLDLVRRVTGLPAVVIPHFDNAEGGHHDTRFCYLGERRLSTLEQELPDDAFVLGVDEHTAVLLDIGQREARVLGNGGLTVRRRGVLQTYRSGSVVGFAELEAGAEAGVEAGTVDATPPSASEPAEPAGLRSLGAVAEEQAQRFDGALGAKDVDGCVSAILDLEQALQDWLADTEIDERDAARATLRRMAVRLGEMAVAGARDPRDTLGPYVTALLDLRRRARQAHDYVTSDWIRDRLTDTGIEVRDTPEGVVWSI